MYTPFYENILFPHIQFKYIYPVIQLVQVNFEKHPNTISKNTSFLLVRNLTYGALSDFRRASLAGMTKRRYFYYQAE